MLTNNEQNKLFYFGGNIEHSILVLNLPNKNNEQNKLKCRQNNIHTTTRTEAAFSICGSMLYSEPISSSTFILLSKPGTLVDNFCMIYKEK